MRRRGSRRGPWGPFSIFDWLGGVGAKADLQPKVSCPVLNLQCWAMPGTPTGDIQFATEIDERLGVELQGY